MIPTPKLRFIKRTYTQYTPYGEYTKTILQQWWEDESDHAWGGEWRDVPLEESDEPYAR